MIQLVAFLGNPGPLYVKNRHNAGRLLAGALPFSGDLKWAKKFRSLHAEAPRAALGGPPEGSVHFIMPELFMNLCGQPIFTAASFYKIKSEAFLAVHDELELPLGTISLKYSGGLGGHNGLRSLKSSFKTADFWRLRIGIGRPDARKPGGGGRQGSGEGVADWVLSDFSADEEALLQAALLEGSNLLLQALSEDPQSLLPQWAKKKVPPQ